MSGPEGFVSLPPGWSFEPLYKTCPQCGCGLETDKLITRQIDVPKQYKYYTFRRFYATCPRCNCDLQKQIDAPIADQGDAQNIKHDSREALPSGIAASDESWPNSMLKWVVNPFAQANKKHAQRNQRRGYHWKFFEYARAGKGEHENANNHDHLVPRVKVNFVKRVLHGMCLLLKGGRV